MDFHDCEFEPFNLEDVLMKRLSLITGLFLLTISAFAFGATSHGKGQSRRIFIDAEKVKTTDKGIFITVDNELIPVSCIFSDTNGHFFIKEAQLKNDLRLQTKRLHRCWCHNPDCPRESRIFIATHWRKYCSERCMLEAINNGYDRHTHLR